MAKSSDQPNHLVQDCALLKTRSSGARSAFAFFESPDSKRPRSFCERFIIVRRLTPARKPDARNFGKFRRNRVFDEASRIAVPP
jgi:hypothetical protein